MIHHFLHLTVMIKSSFINGYSNNYYDTCINAVHFNNEFLVVQYIYYIKFLLCNCRALMAWQLVLLLLVIETLINRLVCSLKQCSYLMDPITGHWLVLLKVVWLYGKQLDYTITVRKGRERGGGGIKREDCVCFRAPVSVDSFHSQCTCIQYMEH